MATGTQESIVSADELPADRLFRLDADRLSRGITAGILAPDHGNEGRLSLDQYHRLGDAGILNEGDRVELLGGWLVARIRINPPHRVATRKTRIALERIVPAGWYVDQSAPVTLAIGESEPEPDVQVTKGNPDDFARHAGPQDVALVVEVSDTTLRDDRGYQKRLYAINSVPMYWIVNLVGRCLEVYSEPSGPSDAPDYRARQILGPEQQISLILDGREVGLIPVRDLLP